MVASPPLPEFIQFTALTVTLRTVLDYSNTAATSSSCAICSDTHPYLATTSLPFSPPKLIATYTPSRIDFSSSSLDSVCCIAKYVPVSGPENLFPLVADTRAYRNIGTSILSGTFGEGRVASRQTSKPLITHSHSSSCCPLLTSHKSTKEAGDEKGTEQNRKIEASRLAAGYPE